MQYPIDKGHGGGGGLYKVTENEIRLVIRIAESFPQFRCRRLAYSLERTGVVYIGKPRLAQILKENVLDHEFVRQRPKPDIPPDDCLKHEPWKKNLIWGADWTWVNVNGSFMYLLVVIDWYSRLIVSRGLFTKITSIDVVAVSCPVLSEQG